MKVLLALLFALLTTTAHAESWCAYPLWVHEWGVHVFGPDSSPAGSGGGPTVPAWFHTAPPAPVRNTSVRNLPADGGIRRLPVVHFYSAASLTSPIPIGVEVGFTQGPASLWFPQVDVLVPEAQANSPAAMAKRLTLLAQRAARGRGELAGLDADPTRQLVWNRLDLAVRPTRPPTADKTPWIKQARAFDDALWVNGPSETERFLFYEGPTRERVPLVLRRGPKRHGRELVLENTGAHAVHDLILVHRDAGQVYVVSAPSIPAGKSFTFLLEDHGVAPKDFVAATRGRLGAALLDTAQPAPPKEVRWNMTADGGCVMGRDPAIPFEKAEGHRLYQSEVDVILGAWAERFFDQPGTSIVFREDLATLDDAMPLSLYTDMYNYVVLRRAGLALWEDVPLP